MKSHRLKPLVLGAILAILLCRSGDSCGPYASGVIFTRNSGPDGSIARFTAGEIGIPLTSWWKPYLVVAYRYLESKPLSQAEARSFGEMWGVEESKGVSSSITMQEAIQRWTHEREKYRAAEKPPDPFKKTGEFSSTLNCLPAAFVTAAATLADRARVFGPQSAELNAWITGQDIVFSSCSGSADSPTPLPRNSNSLLRADRAYQIAATEFYRGDFDAAVRAFDAIAQDNTSPWSGIAPYLSVRCLIRKDGLENLGSADGKALEQIQRRLDLILKDPTHQAFHHDARKLKDLIEFRLHPAAQEHRLAEGLQSGASGEDFGQELRDYTLLLDSADAALPDFPGIQRYTPEYDKKLAEWRAEQEKKSSEPQSELKNNSPEPDITDWLRTMQGTGDDGASHAIERWRNTHSQAWLFAALVRVDPLDPAVAELLRAAEQVHANAAGFVAINSYRATLLRISGHPVAARKVLAHVLDARKDIPISARNLLQDEQVKVAANLQSFSKLLAHQPATMSNEYPDPQAGPGCYGHDCVVFYGVRQPTAHSRLLPQFDETAASLLNNRIDLATFAAVTESDNLPRNLQEAIAPAAWARAALLDKPDIASQLSNLAISAQPELKLYVEQYERAATPEERRFAAAFVIAHFPGLRPYVDDELPRTTEFAKIDSYRNNWWCRNVGTFTPSESPSAMSPEELKEKELREFPFPVFLTNAQIGHANSEIRQLLRLGKSSEYLPTVLIRWAKAHSDDPRSPEGLHFAVRVTRYSCFDYEPTRQQPKKNLSREAFELLHRRYPESLWTKKTPYWFD
jgi:hypothetical protein